MMAVYLRRMTVSSIIANVVLENLSLIQKHDYQINVEDMKYIHKRIYKDIGREIMKLDEDQEQNKQYFDVRHLSYVSYDMQISQFLFAYTYTY